MKRYMYFALIGIAISIPGPSLTAIITLTSEQEYGKLINNTMVLVDFYADWCGPCKELTKRLQTAHEKYPGLIIVRVNIDKYPDIAAKYHLRALPAIYFYSYSKPLLVKDPESNQLSSRIIGLRSQKDLETIIKSIYN